MVGKTVSEIKNNETEFTYLTRMVGSFMGDEKELKHWHLLSIALFLFCFIGMICIGVFVDVLLSYKSVYSAIPELIIFASSVIITFFSWQLLRKVGLHRGVKRIANRIKFKRGIQTGLAVMQFEHFEYLLTLLNELFLPKARIMKIVLSVLSVVMCGGAARHAYLTFSNKGNSVDLVFICLLVLVLILIFFFSELQAKTERLLDDGYLVYQAKLDGFRLS